MSRRARACRNAPRRLGRPRPEAALPQATRPPRPPRSPPPPRAARRPTGNARRTTGPFLASPFHSLLPRPARAPMDAAEGLVVADELPGRPYKGALRSCPGRAAVKPPPAPLLATAVSSRPGRLCTKPSPSSPSLASTKTQRRARHSHRAATPPVFQPRRPPGLAAGAPLADPFPGPTNLKNRSPRTQGPSPARARPAPAGGWPEFGQTAAARPPRDYIAKERIFSGASLRKGNSNSKSALAVCCKLRRKP
jgi:hypothetical protein